MALFLDSTVVIDILRGNRYARELRARDPHFISAITVHEVWLGLRGADDRDVAADLLAGMVVVPVGAEEARLSGYWRRQFAREGVTLSLPDTLIAAGAVLKGTPLATANVGDFPMSELHVERWPPAEG